MEVYCSLCSIKLSKYPIVDKENRFCCSGCHAVYNILLSKQQLDNFQESIVFKQALKAGLISNPALLEQIRKKKLQTDTQELEKLHLEISEMWCPSCAEVIRLILLQQKGVINCVVDYATDLAAIEFSPLHISKEKIYECITSLGYGAMSLDNPQRKKVNLDLYIRFGIAAFCALNAMMFSYPLYATYFDPNAYEDGKIFAWLTFFSSLPVVTYCMWPIWQRFLSSLKIGLLAMEALVVTGVIAAFAFSFYELMHESNQVYFDSMTVIITFVLLGKIIETKAKFSAKESLFRLTKSLPRRGRKCFLDGSIAYVPVKEISPGDTVIAYAGEKIILDGEVIEGEGTCDESLMTGESLPVSKHIGSKLLGGSILQHGILRFKVLNHLEETILQRIINAVEHDLEHKSVYVRAADRVVSWFVPLVFILAFCTWAIGWALDIDSAALRAISVLLIACPCAIGIAAPLAESQMLYQLTLLGVIIRNRGCLSLLQKISVFIFDKTGTVTLGNFTVQQDMQGMSKNDKSLLKTVSKSSNHLVSRAIYNAIDSECVALDHLEECSGKGMKGFVSNQLVLLGSAQWMIEHGLNIDKIQDKDIEASTRLQDSTVVNKVVYFSPDGIHVRKLSLGDCIRAEVPDVLKQLGAHTILLSGDSQSTVAHVAVKCGFHAFFSEVNPLQKRAFIEELRNKGEVVCMVGDGINDAPALTAANIGISVVSASDISIQVSDILLTTEQLKVLPKMLELISKGQRILKQNLFWAFFYNIIGIGLAICGLLSPIFAAVAMTVSSLIVLFNSKRIHIL